MFRFLSPQRWWQTRRPEPQVSASYEVVCACGRTLHGQRQRAAQTVSCPTCGWKRFVLPSSPWPRGGVSSLWSLPVLRAAAPRLHLGRLLSVIVVGGAAAMILLFLATRLYLRRPTKATSKPAADVRVLVESGRRELREGNVRLALRAFQTANEQRENDPAPLDRDEQRRLDRLRRQCDLLARLLDDPLEDILQQALRHRNAEEWQAKFADYRGRTVLFDDVLRSDAAGRPLLGFYAVRAGEVEARVALEDLALLQHLPLDPPRRWLFGARLASCRREAGGVWVFHFEPDSAVLLTDEDVAAACWSGPLDDDLRALLQQQEEWLTEFAVE